MRNNALGKNLDQTLALYQAGQTQREARVDTGGQNYQHIEAQLSNGGKISGKIVPNDASQLSWIDVFDADGQRTEQVTFGHDGLAHWQENYEYGQDPKSGMSLIELNWDKEPNGEPNGRWVSQKNSKGVWEEHTEIDANRDGHIDTIGPTTPSKIVLNQK